MSFGRLESKKPAKPMSDINMTPLIDVMLVLLVIFMIAAPLMTSSLRLDLPQAEGTPSEAQDAISLALDAQGQRYLDEQPVDEAALKERLAQAARRNPQTEVQLRADRGVPYGRVAELLALLQEVGLTRIGFITEPPQAAATVAASAPK
ncbi:ExbD/TolR family protein [Azohydromonas caseinilytica]|uniref:Biopolymer transporter ExbD n=1 Tax=Azohydromonas caseinilytica TaxID=2728836 RepID=A0A848FBM8_9BURK|nr:biopolymer transporter ExbD [Azohydromonas caseinilytica]NML16306.1 biopolymer transporter ExbD [Azohydromonas caseinilytica]